MKGGVGWPRPFNMSGSLQGFLHPRVVQNDTANFDFLFAGDAPSVPCEERLCQEAGLCGEARHAFGPRAPLKHGVERIRNTRTHRFRHHEGQIDISCLLYTSPSPRDS